MQFNFVVRQIKCICSVSARARSSVFRVRDRRENIEINCETMKTTKLCTYYVEVILCIYDKRQWLRPLRHGAPVSSVWYKPFATWYTRWSVSFLSIQSHRLMFVSITLFPPTPPPRLLSSSSSSFLFYIIIRLFIILYRMGERTKPNGLLTE